MMTTEEAIKVLRDIKLGIFIDTYFDEPEKSVSKENEALDMAIKALEQQPKTGHWIEKEDYNLDIYYDCSECGESFCLIDGTPTDNLYNYCPNCGTKMVEPQESEVGET